MKKRFNYKKKGFSLVSLIVVFVLFLINQFSPLLEEKKVDPALEKGDLIINVLDIGQGDAILIRTKQKVVLIDSGDVSERYRLKELLKKYDIKDIDILIATHPHSDHIGGMDTVLKNFKVEKVLDSGQVHTSKTFFDYLKLIEKKHIPFVKATAGDKYFLDDNTYLEVLWPKEKLLQNSKNDLNNNSVVVKLVKDDFSMLFTGDIEKQVESILVSEQKEKLASTILKSPHHSSNSSSSKVFLQAVNAEAVIISCGKDNDYSYPNTKVLKRYKDNKMDIYVTANQGTVTIQSDGKTYKITTER